MNSKSLTKQIMLYGLLPFGIISIAMFVFGMAPVHNFLKYTSPIMLLPLVMKILKKIKEKKKQDTKS